MKGNYNYVVTLHAITPSSPLVWLLCACSDLISSFHRQGQSRERINTRGASVGIEIADSSQPPKAANTKAPTAKEGQHYPKSHLSVSSLHSRATEISINVSTVESAFPYPSGPTATEQQCHAQNATQSTPTLPTSTFHHVRQQYLPCFH